MEPEGLLPHSQETAILTYLETDQSSPCPHIPLFEDPFLIIVKNNFFFGMLYSSAI
jgi:hypothetical protein